MTMTRIDGRPARQYQHTATEHVQRLYPMRHESTKARSALGYWVNALRRCRYALARS